MPKGERRSKKEILMSQIEIKDNKIDFFSQKIERLSEEKLELQNQLRELIEAEARAKEEAENNELMKIIKKYNITKEQLECIINNQN